MTCWGENFGRGTRGLRFVREGSVRGCQGFCLAGGPSQNWGMHPEPRRRSRHSRGEKYVLAGGAGQNMIPFSFPACGRGNSARRALPGEWWGGKVGWALRVFLRAAARTCWVCPTGRVRWTEGVGYPAGKLPLPPRNAFSPKPCFRKKRIQIRVRRWEPKQPIHRPAAPPNAKTSEWKRADHPKGGAGGHPPRLFASGLSLEKAWIPARDRAGNHVAGLDLRRSQWDHLPMTEGPHHPKGTQYPAGLPPGTGRETTSQGLPCAGPSGTSCR